MDSGSSAGLGILDRNRRTLWGLAVCFFGVGDLVTTGIGLRTGQVVEVGPVAGPLVRALGFPGMVVLKLLFLAGCFIAWRRVPDPDRVGIPLALAVMGVLITAWNLWVLTTVG
jgi:hypothetical protein